EVQGEVDRAINEAGTRYIPLEYRYSEVLLDMLDKVEAHLSGRTKEPPPRYMSGKEKRPGLEPGEELDHFREVIRRWEPKTGKNLGATRDRLKPEVADRPPNGEPFNPAFQKRFSKAFDDLIQIEVQEIRERRNRAIHEAVRPVFAKYRQSSPEIVR